MNDPFSFFLANAARSAGRTIGSRAAKRSAWNDKLAFKLSAFAMLCPIYELKMALIQNIGCIHLGRITFPFLNLIIFSIALATSEAFSVRNAGAFRSFPSFLSWKGVLTEPGIKCPTPMPWGFNSFLSPSLKPRNAHLDAA
jgi:hypothetical protein